MLALDGVYPFELGIPSRIFEAVDGLYEVSTCSVDGGPVRTASDFTIEVSHGPELLAKADVVVISSIATPDIPLTLPETVATAIARIPDEARIISICTGAFVLAAAGKLDHRRATTHWQLTDQFVQRFPKVQLDPDVLFVEDGAILTSAGAASGIDACLHLVRLDHGSEVANTVARRCVVPPFRDGGQAQYIERPLPDIGQVGTLRARNWALQNLHQPISLKALADVAGTSPRTFSRRFTEEVGVSPGKWVLRQRIMQAQRLLEGSDLAIDRIAESVGFATAASLRQHFHAAFGITPTAYRRTFLGARR
ncbi:MAG: helix-turn-helix domain-containing protein [Nocardioidaceae bacterium]